MYKTQICKVCGKEFTPTRNNQKYCSRECYHSLPVWNKDKKGLQKAWNKQNVFSTCEYCGKKYKTVKSQIGKTRFCSRACQNKWHAKHHDISGNNNPMYNGGIQSYRKLARKVLPNKCDICGSTENLIVHHIDGNRRNNPANGSNWRILCRRCHQVLHDCTKNLPEKRESKKEKMGIKKSRMLKTFICPVCHKTFHPFNNKQKFCSRNCALKNRHLITSFSNSPSLSD